MKNLWTRINDYDVRQDQETLRRIEVTIPHRVRIILMTPTQNPEEMIHFFYEGLINCLPYLNGVEPTQYFDWCSCNYWGFDDSEELMLESHEIYTDLNSFYGLLDNIEGFYNSLHIARKAIELQSGELCFVKEIDPRGRWAILNIVDTHPN